MNATKELFSDEFYNYIAPKIIGNELVRRVVSLQLFTNPLLDERLHIMLIGVPASGKSVIIKEVSDIRPRANYMSSNITKVGLREKAGCSNGSILSIDEMDKLHNDTLTGLLELMQFGTISVDIHNKHYTIQSKVNVVCACNPKWKVWLNGQGLLDQIPFKTDLLTRFHIILPFYKVDPSLYPEIASKMCVKLDDTERINRMRNLVVKIMNEHGNITIPKEIGTNIGQFIRELEQLSLYREIISPRTIEGFISCIKARARLRLSNDNKANEDDFNYVKELFNQIYLNEGND
jgi:DNA replicative helicase MCM subunit Mcm2 (Cdc46/Mcm family)